MDKKLLDSEFTQDGGLIRLKQTRKEKASFDNDAALAKQLERETLQRIKNGESPTLVFDAVSSKMWELELSEGWTGQVFGWIDSEIRDHFDNTNHLLSKLEASAIGHFVTILKSEFNVNLYKEIENNKLAEIIEDIKERIENITPRVVKDFDLDYERFKLAALEKLHHELETEFTKRVSVEERRKQLRTREEKSKQSELVLSNENNQITNAAPENDFYKSAKNLRQKVFFYLVTKYRMLEQPNTLTRAELGRNIATVTGGNYNSIIDVIQNKLQAKKDSTASMRLLATDLRVVFSELKNRKDNNGCQIVKNEILSLGEDVNEIKQSY